MMLHPLRSPRRDFLLAAIAVLTLLAAGCSLIEGDDEGGAGGSGDAGGVRAESVVLTTDLGPLPQPRIVPASTREIRAEVNLTGVTSGMRVTARWFQLGVANVPPEGSEISASEVTLTPETISAGETFVRFNLSSGGAGFPLDSWLLRVYVNGALVRTAGFVIANAGQSAAPPAPEPSGPAATAEPEPEAEPTPISYTVVAGDTLQLIAQRFLPEGETLDAYLVRIAELNEISTSALLQTEQVLLIPGPQ